MVAVVSNPTLMFRGLGVFSNHLLREALPGTPPRGGAPVAPGFLEPLSYSHGPCHRLLSFSVHLFGFPTTPSPA